MIQPAGTPHMVFVVWVVGGLLSWPAEWVSVTRSWAVALPEAGGEYAFPRERPHVGVPL